MHNENENNKKQNEDEKNEQPIDLNEMFNLANSVINQAEGENSLSKKEGEQHGLDDEIYLVNEDVDLNEIFNMAGEFLMNSGMGANLFDLTNQNSETSEYDSLEDLSSMAYASYSNNLGGLFNTLSSMIDENLFSSMIGNSNPSTLEEKLNELGELIKSQIETTNHQIDELKKEVKIIKEQNQEILNRLTSSNKKPLL